MPSAAAPIPQFVIEGVRELAGRWPEVGLLEVSGADRIEWLQGQSTNDLRGIEPATAVDFCVCKPTGQMLAVCRMWEAGERAYLAAELACMPSLLERFEQMVIMEDVAASSLTDRLFPPGDLLPAPAVSALAAPARLEAGIPLRGVDWDERTLPPELGPEFEARHVSYDKGCYTGQEVLMRIHSRGHTNRTWMALVADGPVGRGDAVSHPDRADAGTVTAAARSERWGWIGAAMLRTEAAKDGERVSVESANGPVAATARHFPLAP